MEDLLNEDDFAVKTPYNHWKDFRKFYYVTAVLIAVITIYMPIVPDSLFLVIVYVLSRLSPIMISSVMIFYKKENRQLPLRTIAGGILGLVLTCTVTVEILSLIRQVFFNLEPFLFGIKGGLFYLIACNVIIIPLAALMQRKTKSPGLRK